MDQSFITGENVPAHLNIGSGGFLSEVADLTGSQFHFHATQQIDDLLEMAKVNFHTTVHFHAEVLIEGVTQQIHAAVSIGCVDTAVLIAGDGHIQVAHEGSHGQGIAVQVKGTQDHGVGSCTATLTGILADQQDVHNAVAADDHICAVAQVNLAVVQLGTGELLFLQLGLQKFRIDGVDLFLRENLMGRIGIHIIHLVQQMLHINRGAQQKHQHHTQHDAQGLQRCPQTGRTCLLFFHVYCLHFGITIISQLCIIAKSSAKY